MTSKQFFSRWHGQNLDICLPNHESKTYYEHNFQPALKRYMNGVAKNLGATLTWTKGYWFETFVFERNGHYVYLHHEPFNRNFNDLNDFYARTMAHATDWRGGSNNNINDFSDIESIVDKLLNTEHEPFRF